MFYLIDKPIGISSFDVIRRLRKSLGIKKMWHAGTLDPFASGCLIIATDKSTKLIPYIEGSEKEYIASIDFSGITESLDTETPVTPVALNNVIQRSDDEIIDFLYSQKTQVPPKYSALHIDGKRAYSLARKGQTFDLPTREIMVSNVAILERTSSTITLRMRVSSGCYMRSFGPILWNFFWSEWWYLTNLQRIWIYWKYWFLTIETASTIENPIELDEGDIFQSIETREISDSFMQDIIDGRDVTSYSIENSKNNSLLFVINKKLVYKSLCEIKNGEFLVLRNNI